MPGEDDEVVETHGARVFLEPKAALLLDDKLLDASVEQDEVSFAIVDQPELQPRLREALALERRPDTRDQASGSYSGASLICCLVRSIWTVSVS